MSIERILLIRHGETAWNAEGRWQGHEMVPLNDNGRDQARKLANYLMMQPIGSIYTSDLPRAHQTATFVAETLGITPIIEPRFREWHLGVFQGLTRDDVAVKYPSEFAESRTNYLDYIIPNGESRRQMQMRAYEAWEEIVKEGVGPEVAIFSHGGTLKVLLLRLFESDAHALREIHIENTSITTIERYRDYWRIIGLAATPHLIE